MGDRRVYKGYGIWKVKPQRHGNHKHGTCLQRDKPARIGGAAEGAAVGRDWHCREGICMMDASRSKQHVRGED